MPRVSDWVRYSGNKKVRRRRTATPIRVVRTHSVASFHRFSLYRFRFPPAVCPRSASCPFIPISLDPSQERIDNHQDQECIDVMPPFAESKCSIIREIGSFFTFLRRSIFVGPSRPWNGSVRRILWSSQEKKWTKWIGRNLAKVNLQSFQIDSFSDQLVIKHKLKE